MVELYVNEGEDSETTYVSAKTLALSLKIPSTQEIYFCFAGAAGDSDIS